MVRRKSWINLWFVFVTSSAAGPSRHWLVHQCKPSADGASIRPVLLRLAQRPPDPYCLTPLTSDWSLSTGIQTRLKVTASLYQPISITEQENVMDNQCSHLSCFVEFHKHCMDSQSLTVQVFLWNGPVQFLYWTDENKFRYLSKKEKIASSDLRCDDIYHNYHWFVLLVEKIASFD